MNCRSSGRSGGGDFIRAMISLGLMRRPKPGQRLKWGAVKETPQPFRVRLHSPYSITKSPNRTPNCISGNHQPDDGETRIQFAGLFASFIVIILFGKALPFTDSPCVAVELILVGQGEDRGMIHE